MIKVASIDTNVVIWGINKVASPNQKKNIFKAQKLINDLTENGYRIAITTHVIAELLTKIPDDKKSDYLNMLKDIFVILDFDDNSQITFGKLFKKLNTDVPKAERPPKHGLKADLFILSTVISHGVNKFITNDNDLYKYAKNQSFKDIDPVYFDDINHNNYKSLF